MCCTLPEQKLCKSVGEVRVLARFEAISSVHVLTTYIQPPVGDQCYTPEACGRSRKTGRVSLIICSARKAGGCRKGGCRADVVQRLILFFFEKRPVLKKSLSMHVLQETDAMLRRNGIPKDVYEVCSLSHFEHD
jgi:hypothetical protein